MLAVGMVVVAFVVLYTVLQPLGAYYQRQDRRRLERMAKIPEQAGFEVFVFPTDWERDDTRFTGLFADAGIAPAVTESALPTLGGLDRPLLVAKRPPASGMLSGRSGGTDRIEVWQVTLPSRSTRTAVRRSTTWTVVWFAGAQAARAASKKEKRSVMVEHEGLTLVGVEGIPDADAVLP